MPSRVPGSGRASHSAERSEEDAVRRVAGVLGCSIAWIALSGAAPQPPEEALRGRIIDRVVASVASHVITLSELEFEARVALIQHGGLQAAHAPLDDRALRAALELAVAERLETDAADRLQVFNLEESEVASALSDFKSKFPTKAELAEFLARHEADEQQLAAVLARRLRAEKIVDSKVSLQARVTDDEMRRYYDAHHSELGGSYEQMRAAIRTKLLREPHETAAAGARSLSIPHSADAAGGSGGGDVDPAGSLSQSVVDRASPARADPRMVDHFACRGAHPRRLDASAWLFDFLVGAGRAAHPQRRYRAGAPPPWGGARDADRDAGRGARPSLYRRYLGGPAQQRGGAQPLPFVRLPRGRDPAQLLRRGRGGCHRDGARPLGALESPP